LFLENILHSGLEIFQRTVKQIVQTGGWIVKRMQPRTSVHDFKDWPPMQIEVSLNLFWQHIVLQITEWPDGG
jgi:hypothetical protein